MSSDDKASPVEGVVSFDLARSVASMLLKLDDNEKKAINQLIIEACCPVCVSSAIEVVCPACGRPYGPVQANAQREP